MILRIIISIFIQSIHVRIQTLGGVTLTVITNVKTTLASLKGAQANFETFALSTDNQQAKTLYQDAAKQTQSIIDSISPRLQEIQQEEPQYNE